MTREKKLNIERPFCEGTARGTIGAHRIKKHVLRKQIFYEKRRWICLALTAALTIGMLAGCGQKKDLSDGGEKKKLQKVTLNEVAHSIFYAPMYVAIEEGYFKEEGIDLTLVTGFGADKTVTAVLAGEADIGFMGSESTIYTKNGGAEDYLINFAQLTQRAGNFLVAREPIENFEWDMLKGKKVLGGRAGGMPEWYLNIF